jgi:Putative peptidoglycan binding domain
MHLPSRLALATGALLLGGAAAVVGPTASASTPVAHSATAHATQHPDSAASRCLIWWKTTDNYAGYTAGYSWAWNVTVGPGATGDRVKEIQCLTDYWVGEPASLDGVYGPATEQAVHDTQALLSGCSADGVVGPDTWRCMRWGGF